jgi:hypothetical protein
LFKRVDVDLGLGITVKLEKRITAIAQAPNNTADTSKISNIKDLQINPVSAKYNKQAN